MLVKKIYVTAFNSTVVHDFLFPIIIDLPKRTIETRSNSNIILYQKHSSS